MIFLALSEQTAATLSAAGFSACLAGGVALIVFGAGQYLTWRLEHTKHLRQKLEELVEAIVETYRLISARPPHVEQSTRLPHETYLSEAWAQMAKIEALQTINFPEVSKQVDLFIDRIVEATEATCDMISALEDKDDHLREAEKGIVIASNSSFDEIAKKVLDAQNVSAAANIKVKRQMEELLEYIAKDKLHLTRTPLFVRHYI